MDLQIPATIRNTDTSAELTALLARLTHDQFRYITARLQQPDRKAAAKSLGLPYSTVTHWPAYVERAYDLIGAQQLESARHLLEHTLVKAMMVKIAGLDSGKETVRQAVATEIIEWNLGRPRQQTDLSVKIDDTDYTAILLGKLFADDAAGGAPGAPGEPNADGSGPPAI
jgi:hypothetical protein